jgi:hypothetical protein
LAFEFRPREHREISRNGPRQLADIVQRLPVLAEDTAKRDECRQQHGVVSRDPEQRRRVHFAQDLGVRRSEAPDAQVAEEILLGSSFLSAENLQFFLE